MSETKNDSTIGIFSVKGIENKNQAQIKHLQNAQLGDNQYIPDEEVKSFEVMHRVTAKIHTCNITHYYLMASNKLPICYISVVLEVPLQKVLLFNLYINFTIESEVNSMTDLLDKKLSGKFTMDLTLENSIDQIDSFDKYPGNNIIYEKLTNFVKSEGMIKFITEETEVITQKLREEYGEKFKSFKIPTKILSLSELNFDD